MAAGLRLPVDTDVGARLTSLEGIVSRLPVGYDILHSRRAWMAVRRDAAQELSQTGYALQADGAVSVSSLAGRKPLLELSTKNGAFLVRRFSHGGLLRGITGSRFTDPSRPFRELSVSVSLQGQGVRTPEIVAARAQRASGFGWRLDLVTRRVEDAMDLGRLLGLARRGSVPRAELRRVLHASGVLVRRLHDLGCVHADLTPSNMLVERASLAHVDPKLWIVDLEGARIVPCMSDDERRNNLRRLLRFVVRREQRHGRALMRSDYARFMRGYDPEGARWKEDWVAIRAAQARNELWHRAGWILESLRSREEDPRET